MTDELNKLRKALDTDPHAAPRRSARDAAISAAMQAFDEKISPAPQDAGVWDRLMNTANTVFSTLKRRRPMNLTSPNLRPMLLGGASLAVLSIAIVNIDHLRKTSPDLVRAVISDEKNRKAEVFAGGKSSQAEPLEEKQANEAEIIGGQRRERDAVELRSDDRTAGSEGSGTAKLADQPGRVVADKLAQSQPATSIAREQKTKPSTTFEALIAKKPDAIHAYRKAETSANKAAPVSSDLNRRQIYQDQGRDKFNEITPNPVKVTASDPVSTFSIDVDTASYAFMRASLNNGVLPQRDAVRVEEMINYFPYDYAPPQDRAEPFATHVSVMPTPWNTQTKLLHIGIKGYDLPKAEKPRSNLVFLLDTSGSMNAPNKLPLLVNSFKLLLESLGADDTVSIVTYAGSAGTLLEPTKVRDKAKILASLDRLRSGGSTAGAEGIRQAYRLAEQNYDKTGVNRVILATDGDFNVGITNQDELKSFVERKRQTGVSLSVLGFGQGNYNDALMQTLAQNGNGNAAYIDSLSEARKVLVEEASSTLFTIAKDVKIQIEFNPATVAEYRLIGYETRLLQREDFNNDKIDAGEIGAGHTVTAIYEMTPVGSKAALVDSLRYQKPVEAAGSGAADEYAFLKLRYKLPDSDTSTLITTPVDADNEVDSVASANVDTRFASAVAAYGQILRGGRFTGTYNYDDVIKLAQGAKADDTFGYRAEFINLVRLAKSAAALEPLKQ